MRKYILGILVLFLFIGVAYAGVMTYFARVDSTITVEPTIFFDGIVAEDLVLTVDFETSGNTTTVFDHNITSYTDLRVYFNWDNDSAIYCDVLYDGSIVEYLDLSANCLYNISTRYVTDRYLLSGTYFCNMTVDGF